MSEQATKTIDHNEKDWVEPKKTLADHAPTAIAQQAEPDAPKRPTAIDAEVNLPGTARTTWEVFVDHRHEPKDLLDPAYWYDKVNGIEAGDYMDAEPNDGAWCMRIRVQEVDKAANTIIVAGISFHEFPRPAPPDNFNIVFVSRAVGFRVERKDGKALRTGFKSYEGAHAWIVGYQGDAGLKG
jgi:hypothetical protein